MGLSAPDSARVRVFSSSVSVPPLSIPIPALFSIRISPICATEVGPPIHLTLVHHILTCLNAVYKLLPAAPPLWCVERGSGARRALLTAAATKLLLYDLRPTDGSSLSDDPKPGRFNPVVGSLDAHGVQRTQLCRSELPANHAGMAGYQIYIQASLNLLRIYLRVECCMIDNKKIQQLYAAYVSARFPLSGVGAWAAALRRPPSPSAALCHPVPPHTVACLSFAP
ncbi:hypothetical protein EVAR_23119_1 [Eumeta japonica]|uniref:Uncharacterized protein n=1 Tax=Eumeta variegata TaxID=151549 RepID=A0A4C1VBG0_EUMVA|nr:hypothetical protein EVAR_23119_1 [Eumeta japonica]